MLSGRTRITGALACFLSDYETGLRVLRYGAFILQGSVCFFILESPFKSKSMKLLAWNTRTRGKGYVIVTLVSVCAYLVCPNGGPLFVAGVARTVREKALAHPSREIRVLAKALVDRWIAIFKRQKALRLAQQRSVSPKLLAASVPEPTPEEAPGAKIDEPQREEAAKELSEAELALKKAAQEAEAAALAAEEVGLARIRGCMRLARDTSRHGMRWRLGVWMSWSREIWTRGVNGRAPCPCCAVNRTNCRGCFDILSPNARTWAWTL